MRKFLAWLKKYSLWILGGIAAILGILLAVNHEKQKIKQFKVDKEIEKKKVETARLQGARDQLLEHERGLAKKDAQLDIDVDALDEKLANLDKERRKLIEEQATPKTAKQVSNRFNNRYGKKRKKN